MIAAQCPFAARGASVLAMSTCPGFIPEPLAALYGDTCGHLGLQLAGHTGRYISACRRPGGVPDGADSPGTPSAG